MKRHLAIAAAAIASLLSVAGSEILGCEWAIDYFYQVTNLRGTVVGSDFPVSIRSAGIDNLSYVPKRS